MTSPPQRISDVVGALVGAGLTASDLALATGVSERTVRRWLSSGPDSQEPAKYYRALDDLRALIDLLSQQGHSPEAIRLWLNGRSDALNFRTPLESIASGTFDDVRAAALADLRVGGIQQGPVAVFRDEVRSHALQLRILEELRPKQVRFLEYSAAAVKSLVSSALTTQGVEVVQLLIRVPTTEEEAGTRVEGMPEWHRSARLGPVLSELYFTAPADDDRFARLEIRGYETGPVGSHPHEYHPSLRGRDYGGYFVASGWYTFDYQPGHQGDGPQLWGHSNPVIVANARHPAGAPLLAMFDRVFTYLWEEPSRTRNLTEVDIAALTGIEDPVAIERWLQRVATR